MDKGITFVSDLLSDGDNFDCFKYLACKMGNAVSKYDCLNVIRGILHKRLHLSKGSVMFDKPDRTYTTITVLMNIVEI